MGVPSQPTFLRYGEVFVEGGFVLCCGLVGCDFRGIVGGSLEGLRVILVMFSSLLDSLFNCFSLTMETF